MALSVIRCFSTGGSRDKDLHSYNKYYMNGNAGLTRDFWQINLLEEWLYPHFFVCRAFAQLKTGEAIDGIGRSQWSCLRFSGKANNRQSRCAVKLG
jgi:hypothetical protein